MEMSKKNLLAKPPSATTPFMRNLFFMGITLHIHGKIRMFLLWYICICQNVEIIWNFCVNNPTKIYCWCKFNWQLPCYYLLVWHETRTGELQYHFSIAFVGQFNYVKSSLLFIQPLSEMQWRNIKNPYLVNRVRLPFWF